MKTFQFCTNESWKSTATSKKGGEFGPLKKQKKIFTEPFILCHSWNLTSPIATSLDCAGQDVHTICNEYVLLQYHHTVKVTSDSVVGYAHICTSTVCLPIIKSVNEKWKKKFFFQN